MEEGPTIQQSNTLFLVNEYVDTLRFIKCIIPYYDGKNIQLKEELKTKLSPEWSTEDKFIIKLENKLEMQTKYYNANTNIYIIKYDDIIQLGVDQSISQIEEKKLTFDAIFFSVTALGAKQIFGHDKYCQVVEQFSSTYEPQIQTLICQKTDELEVDIEYIIKQEEELECFTESVYEDFKKLSESDEVIKPRAKSMLEETEGITRIIDILESNVWTGSDMISQEKKVKEPSTTKLNIHLPTYEKNKDVREKYEKQLAEEKDQEEQKDRKEKSEIIDEQVQVNDSKKVKVNNAEIQENKTEQQPITQSENETKKSENQQVEEKIVEQQKEPVKEEVNKETQVEIKQKEEEIKVQKVSKPSKDAKKKAQPKFENEDDEDVQESNFNDFVKILQQMKGMKEQTSKLSDEQRKNQAEKFVLGLMDAFGLDEDSEDEK